MPRVSEFNRNVARLNPLSVRNTFPEFERSRNMALVIERAPFPLFDMVGVFEKHARNSFCRRS